MTRNWPASKDLWGAASAYAGKAWNAVVGSGGTGMKYWMEDVGDQLENFQDDIGYITDTAATTSTVFGRLLASELGYRMARTSYTPTLVTAPSTSTSTWTGNFFLPPGAAKIGLVSITGSMGGTWSGSNPGYIEVSLPSGWTSQATHEGAVLSGYITIGGDIFGRHFPCIGVVHPGTSVARVITTAATQVPVGQGTPGYCTAAVTTNLFTCGTVHGLTTNDPVRFRAADATGVPSPLVNGTTYYVIASGLTTTAFKVSTAVGGSTITLANGNVMCEKFAVQNLTTQYWLAVDGINAPFTFGSGDKLFLEGFVLLA